MLRPEHSHHLQSSLELILGLQGQTRHNIHIDIGKTGCADMFKGTQKIIPAVNSSQQGQLIVIGRLQADRDAVDPHPLIGPQSLCRHGPRV